MGSLRSWLGIGALLLGGAAPAGCANSKPWAACGQECGSPCWPGPRLGCPEACLLAPCPPEPWCPEKKKPKCKPRPRACAIPAEPAPGTPQGATMDPLPSAPPQPEPPAAPAAREYVPAPTPPTVPAGDLPPPPAGEVPPMPGTGGV